jgi:ketosteroid isomerase-like protein
MKHLLIALALTGAASSAAAQEVDVVRRIDVSWGEAFRTCNLPLMGRLLHEDLVFIIQSGIVHHRDDQLKSVGRCDMKQMDVTPARVQVFGTVALVHGTLDYRLDGARATSGRLLYSRAYLKDAEGEWLMVQHQSTAVPQK